MVKLRSFIVNITNFSQNYRDYKIAARYQIPTGIWTFRTLTLTMPLQTTTATKEETTTNP